MSVLIVSVLVVQSVVFQVTSALEWTSSASLPNGTTIAACTGQKVTLPWTFNVTDSERMVDIEWYYAPPEGTSRGIASFVFSQFMKAPTTSQDLGFLPNAGIEVNHVTVVDSGRYSVLVSIRGELESPAQVVTVEVSDPPATEHQRLQASMAPKAVMDATTREWNIQLFCGRFTSLGQPPVSMVWKTPSGAILPSTTQVNGVFSLTVPNPQDGDYTCLPDNATSSVACVQSDSPFHTGATVRVNAVESRLAIMEGRLGALQTENTELTNEVASLRHVNYNLTSEVHDLKDRLQEVIISHPTHCRDVQTVNKTSGVHTVYLSFNTTIPVYCDMDTDGGGWTVIQRRRDGSVDFYRNWQQYESFFGNLGGEFWLGLANIHQLTSKQRTMLRVDLEAFDGSTAYAEYTDFSIAGADDAYRLRISGYNGTAGDSLQYHRDMQFSTYDRDNDSITDYNCAVNAHGGYWYFSCTNSNLNGRYGNISSGAYWHVWKGYESLKHVEMKICPGE